MICKGFRTAGLNGDSFFRSSSFLVFDSRKAFVAPESNSWGACVRSMHFGSGLSLVAGHPVVVDQPLIKLCIIVFRRERSVRNLG